MVKEKNPYENTGTIDIPTFGQKKREITESIDLSVLKLEEEEIQEMNKDNYDEEIDDEEEYEDDEEEEERAPRKVNVGRVVILVESILLVVMAALLVLTMLSANKKSNALKEAEEKYDSYVKKAETNEASYKDTIAKLQEQIAASTAPSESGSGNTPAEGSNSGTKYKIVGDGIRVRTGPGTGNSTASVSNLPSGLTARDEPYLYAGETVTVLETKKDSSGNTWGRIGKDAWFCINYNGTSYATAK